MTDSLQYSLVDRWLLFNVATVNLCSELVNSECAIRRPEVTDSLQHSLIDRWLLFNVATVNLCSELV